MVDRRLWQRAAAMHRYLLLTGLINAAATGLIIVQALIISGLVADLVTSGWVDPLRLQRNLAILFAIAIARAVLTWAQDQQAVLAARQVIADLRQQVITHVIKLGPRWQPTRSVADRPNGTSSNPQRPLGSQTSPVETAIAATQGLDDLEPYLVRYLPSLLLTALITPAALLVIGGLDWIALVIVLISLPLVPLFMWLIGTMTAGTSERRLAVVARLGSQVLDLLTGLPTLKAFGREIGPGARVRALGDASRQASMSTLRIAFLSSMVLELLTTIAVAMVAVSVGLRLVDGGMTLRAGLAVIMLAPEVFNPLRQVAAQFHASTDGLAATNRAFAILDQKQGLTILSSCARNGSDADAGSPGSLIKHDRPEGSASATSPQGSLVQNDNELVTAIILAKVSVAAGDRTTFAPANLTARIDIPLVETVARPSGNQGHIVALVGPSGSGKSTTALLILGLLSPDEGSVILETADGKSQSLTEYGLENWWRELIWIPQRPALDGRNRAFSIGQRQQLALKEVQNAGPEKRLLILDEPTAHLDAASEQTVLETLKAWRDSGRTAIVVAHRPTLIALADQIIEVQSEALR